MTTPNDIFVFHFNHFTHPEFAQGLTLADGASVAVRVGQVETTDKTKPEELTTLKSNIKVFFPPSRAEEAQPIVEALKAKGCTEVDPAKYDKPDYVAPRFNDRVVLAYHAN